MRTLHRLEQFTDLRIWGTQLDIEDEFLIIGNQAVLSFSLQPEGTPMLTVHSDWSQVYRYRQLVMRNRTQEQSFDRKQARGLLLDNPDLIRQFFAEGLSSVFTLTPVGYLINDEELQQHEPEASIRKAILDLYREINGGPCRTYISSNLLRGHFSRGGTIVPLVGAVSIPTPSRMEYIKRFNAMNTKPPERHNVLDGSYPAMLVICTKKLALVYIPTPDGTEDKFHILAHDRIEQSVEEEFSIKTNKLTDHSAGSWDAFLSDQEKRMPGQNQ